MSSADDIIGPIDLLVAEIPASGAGSDGFGMLLSLAERDLIRILDLEVVRRAEDGSVSLVTLAADAMPELAALAPFAGSFSGLMDDDDIRRAGEFLEPGSLGVVVVYENEWTVTMAAALRRDGGRLVASGRIPVEELEAALDGSG